MALSVQLFSHPCVLAPFLFALNSCFPCSMPPMPAAMGTSTYANWVACLLRNCYWFPCSPGTPSKRLPALIGRGPWVTRALATRFLSCSSHIMILFFLLNLCTCSSLCWNILDVPASFSSFSSQLAVLLRQRGPCSPRTPSLSQIQFYLHVYSPAHHPQALTLQVCPGRQGRGLVFTALVCRAQRVWEN